MFIQILDFIGKYGILGVVAFVFIGQLFILPNIPSDISVEFKSFITAVVLIGPFILAIVTFFIYFYVSIPILMKKELHRKLKTMN